MPKLIATVTVAILLLSHVNQSFSQESKRPCEVQCDGSLRKAAEAYVTAMFNLDAKGVMAAYDLESREDKAVAEAVGAGIEYAHSTRVFEEAVTRKFGEPGMKLLAKYLEWTSVTSDIEDVKSYLKQHVTLFIGEDGASAIVAMQWGLGEPQYTAMTFARGRWSVVARPDEAANAPRTAWVFGQNNDKTRLFDEIDEIASIEEFEKRLKAIWQKEKFPLGTK